MDDASKEVLSKNIEDKLDAFFSDDGGDGDQEAEAQTESQTAPISLEELKSLVLSIDWEITDECLTDLINETDKLIADFQDDRPTNALLRMLKALGNYIKKHKAQAHQEAIKRVMSVFQSIETIVQDQTNDEEQKRRIVASEIQAFNILKDQVGIKRAGTKPIAASNGDTGQYEKLNDVKSALAALEANINSQIDHLKNQLAAIKLEMAKK